MDVLVSMEAAKAGISLVSALAELAQNAKRSKHASLQEILQKLRGEATNMARELELALDGMTHELKDLDVDFRTTLRDAERQISGWDLLKRVRFSSVSKRLWRTATALKDFYADIERIYACAQEQEALAPGVDRAYEIRQHLSDLLTNDAPIADVLYTMRGIVHETLTILEA